MKKIKQCFNVFTPSVILIIIVIIFNACAKNISDNLLSFVAALNGSQAIPPNAEAGIGTCNVTYDSISNQLTYTITWKNLTGAPTSVDFQNTTTATEISLSNIQAETDGGTSGNITLAQQDEADLLHKNFYVNIKTAAHSDGEIRGQLVKP